MMGFEGVVLRGRRTRVLAAVGAAVILVLVAGVRGASGVLAAVPPSGGTSDPGSAFGGFLVAVAVALVAGKVGGDLLERMGLPAVVGEVLAGVVVGNVATWLGSDLFAALREGSLLPRVEDLVAFRGLHPGEAVERLAGPGTPAATRERLGALLVGDTWAVGAARNMDLLARMGAIVLLFQVGIASDLREMVRLGPAGLLVALAGVVAPFGLGYGLGLLAFPREPLVPVFLGGVLTATSVGITARVLGDLREMERWESKLILAAAVLDDVLGLVVLAALLGVARSGAFSLATVVLPFLLALGFLAAALLLGTLLTPTLTHLASRLRVPGVKLTYSLVLAFLLAYLADVAGLTAIVGAFAAGLLLDEVDFKDFRGENHRLDELVEPLATFLVPVFFVGLGFQVKMETFLDPRTVLLGFGLTVAAVAGKQVCGLAIPSRRGDRLLVGLGMVPRGEVGLLFASLGRELGVLESRVFAAVVLMVVLTSLLTPAALRWRLRRHAGQTRV